jgi:hypothetical protein
MEIYLTQIEKELDYIERKIPDIKKVKSFSMAESAAEE